MARPLKWETKEDLEKDVLSYFEYCVEEEKMPNKAGLALHLKTTRETLGDYEKKKEFSYAIKEAYAIIEDSWTQNLTGSNAAGSIFYLKAAFQYRDRMDITTDGKPIQQITGMIIQKDKD